MVKQHKLSAHLWVMVIVMLGFLAPEHSGALADDQQHVSVEMMQSEQPLSLAQVTQQPFVGSRMVAMGEAMLLNAGGDYWFKIALPADSCPSASCYLRAQNPAIFNIDFYLFDNGRLLSHSATGSLAWPPGRDVGASMAISGAQDRIVYVHVRAQRHALFALEHQTELAFNKEQQQHWLGWSSFSGLMLGFVIYCVAVWLAYRAGYYGFFALYIASSSIFLLAQVGITRFLTPQSVHSFLVHYTALNGVIICISLLLFLSRLLRLDERAKTLHKVFIAALWVGCIAASVSPFMTLAHQGVIMEVLFAAILVLAIIASVKYSPMQRWGRLLAFSWLPLATVVLALALFYLRPYEVGIYLYAAFAFALVLNCLLIGFAMTLRERGQMMAHRQIVYTDSGTGLANKQLLNKTLKSARHEAITLVMFKPRGLVQSRANFGISHADRYIKSVIHHVEHQLDGLPLLALGHQNSAVVCRFSDDIFALGICGTLELSTIEQAVCVINSVFNEGVEIDDTHLIDQVDFGVANYPLHAQSHEQLVRYAMQALYRDRLPGQLWHLYSLEDSIRSQRRLSLASDLKTAISDNQFRIYLQPQICLQDQSVYGAEVLLRWQHPSNGLITPDQFIPIAESAGQIMEITEWVLSECIALQAKLHEFAPKHVMSINISGRDLSNKSLPTHILTSLQEQRVAPSSIMLELTESATIGGQRNAKTVFDEFRRIGVKLAIDDFGTGYSSLSYLSYLGFNELKIDKQFVHNIADSPKDQSICQATCDLAQSLQAMVVAEGIESLSDAQYMRSYGCDIGQGYYFAKPMPVAQYMQWLSQHHDFGLGLDPKSQSNG
ncbi:EAL domain-containing protein [Pseudoalteromonas sp. CnMc7-15]|uniref:EAL domain-containing protein n=1 Tax=unclassified Pseudoalteromonas TaxID=194690 RepID=UPI001EF6420E|nr:EAL domain-containing protein [Pseudoalteromonas sp. CnMc7-15]MCG7564712.1 EAL domain-containing protein [Pseudoalteromonas sp. CnMc7-15]